MPGLDEDSEDLRAFVSRTQSLLAERVVESGGLDTGFHLEYQQGSGTRLTTRGPDDTDFRAFLTTLRPFVMASERIYLPTVLNMLNRRLTVDSLREAAADARSRWARVLRSTFIQLQVNQTTYRADDVWDLFINGLIFHTDRDKAARAQRMTGTHPLSQQFALQVLYGHVNDVLGLIVVTRNIGVRALTDRALG